jgi:hypothetical protein
MGDVVNLRRFRKAAERRTREADAAENRAKFGRPKAERKAEESRAALDARKLDGHRLGEAPAANDDAGEPSDR